MKKLWGGHFAQEPEENAWKINSSLNVDQRLAFEDVKGSIAWANSLLEAKILSEKECSSILTGLSSINEEFSEGLFSFKPSDEDIHTAVERRLTELIGSLAGKLHTGRSRNDQVATDFRLWMLGVIPLLDLALSDLQSILVEKAELAGDALMPGYTHLQRAQPILLAHWWLSHYWPIQRDRLRLKELKAHVSVMPLGSGALAGSSIPVERKALAASLGFIEPSPNSLDAVSDRDFAAEFLFCSTMIGIHLSRLAEQIIIFTTAEFNFLELSDAFSTGSSLMPQKKNPDIFELTRGKSGTLLGLLTGFLVTLKGLPSSYDKDLQEDKTQVFAATDLLLSLLPAISGAVRTIKTNLEQMRNAIDSFMMATDLADYLVGKGVPFREAHTLAGYAVSEARGKKIGLDALPLEFLKTLSSAFEKDVYQYFDPLSSVNLKNTIGGTSLQSVKNQINQIKGE